MREGGVSRGVFKLHYKILHRLGLAMDLGGSYNEAAILIASHRLPGRGEAVGAAEQTGLSSARFFAPCLGHTR